MFVLQKAAAPKNGEDFWQKSIVGIICSIATSQCLEVIELENLVPRKKLASQIFLMLWEIHKNVSQKVSEISSQNNITKQVGPMPESNFILKCIWGQKKCWVKKIKGPTNFG